MDLRDGSDCSQKASMLVRQLIGEYGPRYGVGTLTSSIYDTAWVAMVAKTVDGQTNYLFPSSFEHLLRSQQHDGGWDGHRFLSDVESVLSCLAALLAICRHISRPYQMREAREELEHRKNRAIYFLEIKFSQLDVSSTAIHPDFQPLIAKLLQMLEQECVRFAFQGRELFLQTKQNRRANYNLAALYGNTPTVATHSLEGRVGEIDFDRVSQHKTFGSMMASPASTAAYLMNCSVWDNEAEAYLQHIVSVGHEKFLGGVPTKFPTTVFELTGVISTLLENGFTSKELETSALEAAAEFLQQCLQMEAGVTGFAPYVVSDADNTAKVISTLALLGTSASPLGMIHRFQSRECFKTYTQDRTPSFRTNCLVLKALLDLVPENSEQMSQIEKLVTFLCNFWWTTNGHIEDDSNLSPNYPVMLMVEAFVRLIHLWARGCVPVPNNPAIQDKVIICLFQALTRTLQAQESNGSWGSGGCEATAYAIITLTRLFSLTSAPKVKRQLTNAIENGRKYLTNHFRSSAEPDHVWSGKMTSGSSVLYQAYVLAALRAPIAEHSGPTIESHFEIPLARVTIQTKYHAKQAWFTNVPEWLIQACLVESYLFLPQIRDVRYAVFPYDNLDGDSHFDTIPLIWIAASKLNHQAVGAEFLYQMMIVSLFGRQLEDYMHNVVAGTFSGCLFEVEDIICGIFQELEASSKDHCFCEGYGSERSSTATAISDVHSVLCRFISHVLNCPYVLRASERYRAQLESELLAFLLSRVSQLSRQPASSATDQTAHSYTFAFLGCLISSQSSRDGVGLRYDFLDTPEQQYLAADMCRHMSIISFMSSNAGEESQHVRTTVIKSRSASLSDVPPLSRSVSSASTASSSYPDESLSPVSPMSSVSSDSSGSPRNAFFPKSLDQLPPKSSPISSTEHLQMTRLFDHERRCLTLCLDSIGKAGINQRMANILKVFVDASELSQQIYNDPNIGSCYEPTTANEVIEQACSPDVPPAAPKKRGGSVAAARAALTVPPLAPKKTSPKTPSPVVAQQPSQPQAQKPEQQPSRHAAPQSHPKPSQLTPQKFNVRPSQQPNQPTPDLELPPGFQHKPEQVFRQPSPPAPEQSRQDMPQQTSEQIYQEISQQLHQEISHRIRKHSSQSQSFAGFSERTLTPSQERTVATPVPVEQDWSWNKKPGFPVRRSSRAASEVSRIERIMNDIDGVKLQPKLKSDIQRRTTSESDASWIPPQPKIDVHRRLANDEASDAEAIKLAKVRMQTQKRAEYEAQRKILDARSQISEARGTKDFVNGLQSKSMVDVSKHEVKRKATCPEEGGWVKSPPAVPEVPILELQKGKLHRARRLGGPRWKAPF
ncbi:hypothetical protein N7G274_006590 [Stereocaulon virgatum]|uniref:Uncharacterized protein n=1 Tax=Stereocaulon virgatum TaxID=373712 RepID=A0ABR4A6R9_9LECA